MGSKDLRARDIQVLFADASAGIHSSALVRQGQISVLIDAKPKAAAVFLEEAADILGLYQRRHEVELKLKGAEINQTYVDNIVDKLAEQLVKLARQARQAVWYREIGEGLHRAEGMLLFRRWSEADTGNFAAVAHLRGRTIAAAVAREVAKTRLFVEDILSALREKSQFFYYFTAIAGAA